MSFKKNRDGWPVFLGMMAAVLHAEIFYPGMVAWDMRVQIEEALSGSAGDIHPPVIAAILRLLFHAGLRVSQIFVIQEVLFWTGLAVFLDSLLQLTLPARVSRSGRHGILAIFVLFYLLPITPYNFYAATVVKDTWFTIALLWGLHHFLDMGGVRPDGSPASPRWASGASPGFYHKVISMAFCFASAAGFRHNAVLLLPAACVAAAFCMRNQRLFWIWAALPLLFYAAIQGAAGRAIRIEKKNWNRFYYALELIGYEALNPPTGSEHRFITPYLKPGFRERFKFGELGVAPWIESNIVEKDLFDEANDAAIKAEYFAVLKTHPFLLATVKFKSFVTLLGLEWSWSVWPGRYDLNPDMNAIHEGPQPARIALMNIFDRTAFRRIYRPIVLGHVLWISLNLVLAGGVAVMLGRRKMEPVVGIFLLLFLSFPLGYYLSYLIFSPSADYRYMMPSTLVMQAVVVTCGVGCLHRGRREAIHQGHTARRA